MALLTAIVDNDWRLGTRTREHIDEGVTMLRFVPFIDATEADALLAAISSPVTDPYADQQEYSGTYAIGASIAKGEDDRSVTIQEALTYVTDVTGLSDLSALDPILLQKNEILDLFNFEEGEGDEIGLQYRNLTTDSRATLMNTLTDAQLVSLAPAAPGSRTWVYQNRIFNENADNNTATFSILLRIVTWSAWGHDSYAADKSEWGNAGTANEKETKTKTWNNIRIADVNTALSDVRLGTNTAADSGYIITDARAVGGAGDGAVTIIQEQKKQVDNVDVGNATTPEYAAINPFGWDGGNSQTINTHYERFTAAGLASAIVGESAPSGYTPVRRTPSLGGDGLHTLVYEYQKPTFTNIQGSTPDQTVKNFRIVGREGRDQQNAKSALHYRKTDSAVGIPIDDLEEVRDNTPAEAGWAIESLSAQDVRDGSGNLSRRQVNLKTTGDKTVISNVPNTGNQSEQQIVLWTDLTETDADLICTDATTNKNNMAASAYHTAPSGHKSRNCEKKPSNAVTAGGLNVFDVWRVTWKPKTSTEIWPETTATYTRTEPWDEYRRIIEVDGSRTNQKRTFTLTIAEKYHATLAAAHSAVGGGPVYKGSGVIILGKGRYKSVKKTLSVGSWGTD